MKLVFFIYSLGTGGAERVTATLANHWAARGWDVWVVTMASADHDRYPLHRSVTRVALGLAFESDGAFGALIANGRRILALRRVLKAASPNVAVALMCRANVLLAFAALGLPGIVRIGSERAYPPRLAVGRAWELLRPRAYRRLDAVVAQTTGGREWIVQNTAARRVIVIPNPLTWPLPRHEPVRDPRAVGHPGRRRLLAVGRLEPQKGFDLLLKGFGAIVSQAPGWELVIVGEGHQRSSLEADITAAGLTDVVHLAGVVGNIDDWYQSSDLFALSSRYEGFPNVLLEAMASGVPAVSFDCETGPRDIIRHGIDGVLVPSENHRALGAELLRLMTDDDARSELAQGALEVRSRFAIDPIAREWESAFAACAV